MPKVSGRGERPVDSTNQVRVRISVGENPDLLKELEKYNRYHWGSVILVYAALGLKLATGQSVAAASPAPPESRTDPPAIDSVAGGSGSAERDYRALATTSRLAKGLDLD